MPKFCVEYYSNTVGNGVKKFDSSDDSYEKYKRL